MSLSSTTNRVSYTGDGSSTVFQFPYYFFSPSDLSVYLYQTSSSVVTAQALNTNYTVSGSVSAQGVYPGGGAVVMTSSIPSNIQIVITRSPSPVQNYTLLQNGPINALALTQQLDYLTAITQRLQDEVSRCVQLPDGLGTINATTFNPVLTSATNLPTSGNAPLVLNSGATGWTYGTVATNASGATAYFGTLPVVNGGTGQNSALTLGALIYAQTISAMGQILIGGANSVLTSNGSIPVWGPLSLASGSSVSGALPTQFGGTGANLSPTTNGTILYYQGSSFTTLGPGQSGFFLTSGSSAAPTWSNGLVNPMTTFGDIIFGGSSGSPARLANGAFPLVLTAQGVNTAPIWNLVNNLSLNNMAGQTIKANSSSLSASPQDLTTTEFRSLVGAAPSVTAIQTVGSTAYSIPAGTKMLEIELVGAGAGGGGSGTAGGTAAGAGGDTYFTLGSSVLIARGGAAGSFAGVGGAGGTASLGTGPSGLILQGGGGGSAGAIATSATMFPGGQGGNSMYGGGGITTFSNNAGGNAANGTGGGGSGGATATSAANTGSGGGGGGGAKVVLSGASLTALNGSSLISIGGGGVAGGAGTTGQAGGAGGHGAILIKAYTI